MKIITSLNNNAEMEIKTDKTSYRPSEKLRLSVCNNTHMPIYSDAVTANGWFIEYVEKKTRYNNWRTMEVDFGCWKGDAPLPALGFIESGKEVVFEYELPFVYQSLLPWSKSLPLKPGSYRLIGFYSFRPSNRFWIWGIRPWDWRKVISNEFVVEKV